MEVTKKKAFWLAFGLSLLTYGIFEWWPMSINEYLAGFVNVFCHFLLTWICLTKIKVDGKTNYILLCCALLLGRWLPQIPLHLFFFLDTIYDVYMLVLTATAIMLAAFCQHDKRFSTYLLSFAIIIIMTIPIHHKWIRAIDLKMGLAVME